MQYYSTKLLKQVRLYLKQGGVILYPTESCYGLGCDPTNINALKNLLKLKARNKNKGLILIANQIKQIINFISPLEELELLNNWPEFTTLLLLAREGLARELIGANKKVAVRITKHKLVGELCDYLKTPLVSTSANLAGQISIKNYRDACARFGSQALVLPGITNFANRPSHIIDFQTKAILR